MGKAMRKLIVLPYFHSCARKVLTKERTYSSVFGTTSMLAPYAPNWAATCRVVEALKVAVVNRWLPFFRLIAAVTASRSEPLNARRVVEHSRRNAHCR
jgi:nicotinate-nucleotide pyrophosphorylase